MVRISVIGTAGRKPDNLTKELFNKMIDRCREEIDSLGYEHEDITLISGGAAWADHLAVTLWLLDQDYNELILYIPCDWNGAEQKYADSGASDWRVNPGKAANYYHRLFSGIIGSDSLQQITMAKESGCTLDTSAFGFFNRNSKVADTDVMIAFTWSKTGQPNDGGTLDTWKKANPSCKKIHV